MIDADLSKHVARVAVSVIHREVGRAITDLMGGVKMNDGSGS
jgi:hypothetical protein